MNLKTKLAAGIIMLAGVSAAQATTYSVSAFFNEPMTGGINTEFSGTFDWDGSMVSNFMGTMNESMRGTLAGGSDYMNYGPYTDGFGTPSDDLGTTNTYWAQVNDLAANGTWNLTLDQNLMQSTSGTTVTATIFKENTSDVFSGGGYNPDTGSMKYGAMDGNTPNENAFFTVVFDSSTMMGITNSMVYGDCTVGSLMMAGNACMAGEDTGASMMAGTPLSLAISEVSAVPVPAAAWLFGGALISLFGANRRKSVLPA